MSDLSGFPGVSNVVSVNAGYGVTSKNQNNLLDVTASGGDVTISLAAVATLSNGFRLSIMRNDGSDSDVIINPDGAETINGAASYILTGDYESVEIIGDGSEWFIIVWGVKDEDDMASDSAVHLVTQQSIKAYVEDRAYVKTGWPIASGVTLSFDNGTRTFTVTDGGSAYYYIDGVKYTLGGNKTVVITDTEGLWYIYFSGATLTASQTPWVITDDDKALVAVLYWNATNNEVIFLGYEAGHTYTMDAATHSRLHYAGGAAWKDGLLVSDAGSDTVNVDAGEFRDEDNEIDISDGAGSSLFEQVLSPAELPIYYRSGASAWRIYDTGDKANATEVAFIDGGNDMHYNKLNGTWASAVAGVGKYVAYYAIATNDQTEPVALIMGQRVDNTLAQARANNVFSGLSLSSLPFQEMIVLARIIVHQTAGGNFYDLDEITDLRAENQAGSITSPLITDHGGLGGLGDDDHVQYLLADGSRVYSATGDGFKDEDNMVSDSAVAAASQQSIKAYVDGSALPIIIYRLNTDITGNDDPLGSTGGEWEIADEVKLESKYGDTLVTEANGIFSFSETGYYLINFTVLVRGSTIDTTMVVLADVTDDNSNYSTVSIIDMSIAISNARSTSSSRTLIKISDTSNDKFKLRSANFPVGSLVEGNTNFNETNIMFQKISPL